MNSGTASRLMTDSFAATERHGRTFTGLRPLPIPLPPAPLPLAAGAAGVGAGTGGLLKSCRGQRLTGVLQCVFTACV